MGDCMLKKVFLTILCFTISSGYAAAPVNIAAYVMTIGNVDSVLSYGEFFSNRSIDTNISREDFLKFSKEYQLYPEKYPTEDDMVHPTISLPATDPVASKNSCNVTVDYGYKIKAKEYGAMTQLEKILSYRPFSPSVQNNYVAKYLGEDSGFFIVSCTGNIQVLDDNSFKGTEEERQTVLTKKCQELIDNKIAEVSAPSTNCNVSVIRLAPDIIAKFKTTPDPTKQAGRGESNNRGDSVLGEDHDINGHMINKETEAAPSNSNTDTDAASNTTTTIPK